MSGGKKQTTNTTENATSQTTLPAWMTAAGQQGFDNATATAAANPIQAYTGQMAPGMAAGQMQAGNIAARGTDTSAGDLNAARAMTGAAALNQTPQVGTKATTAQGYGATLQSNSPTVAASHVSMPGQFGQQEAAQYMSPYTENVQQSTLGEMQRQNAMELDGVGDQAQAARSYGGARHALLESETRGRQNFNMMDYLNRSNDAAYTNAQGQFERDRSARMGAEGANQGADMSARTSTASFLDQMLGRNASAANDASQFSAAAANQATQADADRALQAAMANQGASQTDANRMLAAGGQAAQIGGQAQDIQSQSVRDLSLTGGVDQATQAAQDAAAYQEYLRMQSAPLEQQATLMDILSGTPRDTTTTAKSTGESIQKQSGGGLLNTLLGAAQIGASVFSDRRLKRDIELQGRRDDGLGIYRYRYLWDDAEQPLRTGVMADEVSGIIPMAMGPFIDGYHTVNYDRVGALN